MLGIVSQLKDRLSKAAFKPESVSYPEADIYSLFQSLPWCIDDVQLSGGSIQISGWAIPPEQSHQAVTFCFNGQECTDVQYPLERPDIERAFWFLPRAKESGFICRFRDSSVFKQGVATLSYVYRSNLEPVCENHVIYLLDPSLDRTPLPPPERRMRVHGGPSESAFRLEGFSTFVKIEKALQGLGHSWKDFSNILDWGSGCGRMTRYFALHPDLRVTGVDIDADNVEWCKQAYQHADFESVPLRPPTELSDGQFDLLIGISIFTHLKEREQFEWLRELRRISKPGALLLMTVHGNATACRSGLLQEHFNIWQAQGFFDLGGNNDLSGAITEGDYYRNTLHTHEYINQKWKEFFDIVKIIPGYIGNHQDLVVMRRRTYS